MLKQLWYKIHLYLIDREIKDRKDTIDWLNTVECADFTYRMLYIEMKEDLIHLNKKRSILKLKIK